MACQSMLLSQLMKCMSKKACCTIRIQALLLDLRISETYLIAQFEQQAEAEQPLSRPTFMAKFPTTSAKGNIFVLVWKAIERLKRLGFVVLAIVCDGAKKQQTNV